MKELSMNPTREKTSRILKDTFFDLTLCLEAIFLIHRVNNDLVEDIVTSLEEIYGNTLNTLKELEREDKGEGLTDNITSRSYPAIERFLFRLKEGKKAKQRKRQVNRKGSFCE
ncbi:MAG: hypothetical protein DRG25_04715 [Deltaproteobacteria bacterium]|nr:MAG: hypothetical protein DRG25_04715 [Deltaproteobacteria bacterium]